MSGFCVSIKNLNYTTSEEELYNHFKAHNPSFCVIPLRAWPFPRTPPRSLGIAYVSFPSEAIANEVVTMFNGTVFHERLLSVRRHVPLVTPNKPSFFKRLHSRRSHPKAASKPASVQETTEKVAGSASSGGSDGVTPNSDGSASASAHNVDEILEVKDEAPVEDDGTITVSLPRVRARVTQREIEALFSDYSIKSIMFAKTRFSFNHASVVVKVEKRDLVAIEVLSHVRSQMLGGEPVDAHLGPLT
ncbi:hypothetical protein DICA3_B10264 [Diutina catenulata]